MDRQKLMDTLIPAAWEAAKNAYVPYSGFRVGAALLTKSGKLYPGCNIENSIAVVGQFADGTPAGGDGFAYPCGVCRQVMAEFCHPDEFLVLLENHQGERKTLTLRELLPYGFVLRD